MDRDLELLDVQLQHDATWRVLDAAIDHRDLVVKLHAGAVALAPILVSAGLAQRGPVVLLSLSGLLAAFLGTVSAGAFRSTHALRLLQHRLDAATNQSRRNLLAVGQGHTFADRAPTANVRPLREQRDPMGYVVRTVRTYLLVDAAIAVGCAAFVATWSSTPALRLVTGSVAAVGTCALGYALADRAVAAEERSLRNELRGEVPSRAGAEAPQAGDETGSSSRTPDP